MKILELAQVIEDRQRAGKSYLQFLSETSMSLGIYFLKTGATDPQKPHREDEAYYVLSGIGKVRIGDEEESIRPGSVFFVKAERPHHFHSITEDLTLLVFFSPAHQG